MIKRIQKFLRDLKASKTRREYESGFGWACTEILANRMPPHEVEAFVYGQIDPFDRGAQEALRKLDELGFKVTYDEWRRQSDRIK